MPERRHIDLARRQVGQRLDHALQRQAVGQARVAVVQGQVGDPPLAVADLGGHGVEAAGQAADLVLRSRSRPGRPRRAAGGGRPRPGPRSAG